MAELFQSYPILLRITFVIITLCIVFILVKIAQKIGLEKIRAIVYKAFVVAENNFNSGDEKFNYVLNVARTHIPAPFNIFITEKTLKVTIQLWFDLCKDLLDDGRIHEVKDYKAFNEE